MLNDRSKSSRARDVAGQGAQAAHVLYHPEPHSHVPQNPNELHRREQQRLGVNLRFAVWLTTHMSTMQCTYLFAGIGVAGMVGAFTGNLFLALLFGSISSYFLQLVSLPIILVGQKVQGRHQELQADEMYHNTLRLLHENQQGQRHLDAQDTKLLEHDRRFEETQAKLLSLTRATALLLKALRAPDPVPAPEEESEQEEARDGGNRE